MWFNTNFFIPPNRFMFNGEEFQFKEVSFGFSGDKKEG